MNEEQSGDVTQLLRDWNRGDSGAIDEIMPQVIHELKRVASRYLKGEKDTQTLQPTALVNEVYIRLIDRQQVQWEDRAHFFAFAARTMRRILVDYARARGATKRGGEHDVITLIDAPSSDPEAKQLDIVALDTALDKLAKLNEKQARVVELRYFTGLTVDETAETMGIARASVTRHWTLAKAFLYRELSQ
ncbi:MAG: sigma-70 family RNA polymerase sigma factor [Acidobacteriota bacterium]